MFGYTAKGNRGGGAIEAVDTLTWASGGGPGLSRGPSALQGTCVCLSVSLSTADPISPGTAPSRLADVLRERTGRRVPSGHVSRMLPAGLTGRLFLRTRRARTVVFLGLRRPATAELDDSRQSHPSHALRGQGGQLSLLPAGRDPNCLWRKCHLVLPSGLRDRREGAGTHQLPQQAAS